MIHPAFLEARELLTANRRAMRAELAAEVEHLMRGGTSPWQILRALNTNPAALSRRLQRAGRPDLARPFENIRRTA